MNDLNTINDLNDTLGKLILNHCYHNIYCVFHITKYDIFYGLVIFHLVIAAFFSTVGMGLKIFIQ